MEVMLLLLKDCVTVRKNESSSGRHKEKNSFCPEEHDCVIAMTSLDTL